jgi:hypothetical protein
MYVQVTWPGGGGIRSLNVALRQQLDLYVCLRPVRYFKGVPSPVKEPEKVDMVIFRENAEDIYAGIEWPEGSPQAKKVIDFLVNEMGVRKIRFPETSAIGIKPVSREGTERLVRKALQYAIANDREGLVGQPYVGSIYARRLLAGIDLHPVNPALAAVGLRDRSVDDLDHHRRNVDTRPVADDVRDDRIVGNLEALIGPDLDLRAAGRHGDMLVHEIS